MKTSVQKMVPLRNDRIRHFFKNLLIHLGNLITVTLKVKPVSVA